MGIDQGNAGFETTGLRPDPAPEQSTNEWDAYAADWDGDPMVRAYASAAYSSLQDLLAADARSLAGARVLDFGCGTGLLTEHLLDAGAEVHALDTSTAMLAVLRAKRHLFDSGRLTADTALPDTGLPDSGRAFDVVVCASVCSFLDDYPATVAELVALLEPGGLFVQWDWERTPGQEQGLTRDEIAEALHTAGLGAIDVRPGFVIGPDEEPMAPLVGHGRRPPRE